MCRDDPENINGSFIRWIIECYAESEVLGGESLAWQNSSRTDCLSMVTEQLPHREAILVLHGAEQDLVDAGADNEMRDIAQNSYEAVGVGLVLRVDGLPNGLEQRVKAQCFDIYQVYLQ